MATNYPTNEHRTNYSRLCRAVIDLSTDVLRDLLNKQVLPVDILTEIRNIPDSTKVIRKDQWVYIHNAAHLRTYEKFDITLLSSVIRLFSVRDVTSILQQSLQYQTLQTSVQQCPALSTDPKTKLSKQEERDLQNIIIANSFRHGKDELLWKLYTHLCTSNQKPVHPTVPWGSPNMPDPAHITVGDDIERLRHIRNKAYGHVSTSEISKKEYNTYMGILETVMVRMDKEIPGKGYKAALDRIKVTCMDADLEKKFLDDMKKMSESEKAMQEEIKEIKDEFTEIKQDVSGVKEDVSGIKEDASGIKEDVSGIKKEFKGIKEDVSKFKKDFPEIKDDVSGIKEDVSVMQEDVSVIKGDFSGIKKEVLEMKADFSGMEEGVSEMKEDVLEMKEDLSEIKEDVLGMKVDFSEIKEDLSGIKGDVAGTKEDVSGIKDHVSGMKDDVSGIKNDVSGIKNDVSGIQKDVSGTKEDVAGLKKDMQKVKGSLVKEEIRNFCDQATLQIERHKKDKTFVITEAVNKGKDLLEEHGVLIYTGCPGQGKTKNALEMFKAVLAVLLLFVAGQTQGLCQIQRWYRGRFNVVGQENTELIVRRDTMVTIIDGVETKYKCLDSKYDTYLMETQDGSRVICLSIGQMMDTYYEFTVRRLSDSNAENLRFFSTDRRQPGATVENTCTNYNGPNINLVRANSGCQFPPLFIKTWQFEGDFVRSLTFAGNKMFLTYENGDSLEFSCERIDKDGQSYDIAMVKPSMAPRKDGLLCLNITPDGSQMVVKRMNTANSATYNLIKLMYRHPIYLHEQCDLIDAPVYAGRLN